MTLTLILIFFAAGIVVGWFVRKDYDDFDLI